MESNREECGDPVRQVHLNPDMTVDGLVRALAGAGAYNGGSLARAVDIYEAMLHDEKERSFSGSRAPSFLT